MKLLFRWINKLLCGWNVGLYFRPRIRYEGKKCLPAFTRGPAIIITNHKNQMDFLLVLYLFYFRYVRCLVGKTFYECNRFLNWCLRLLGAIKVDRFSCGMDFFSESVEPCGSCCSGCGISPQILQILWAASACALSGCRSSIFRPARSMCARTPVRRCSC